MRRLAVLALVAGCQLFGGGERGSGTPKTEQRTVAAFSKLQVDGAMHADVTVGPGQVVELAGDDNIVPLIATDVGGDELRVGPKRSVSPKLDLTARIVTPKLAAVGVSGSVDTVVRGISSAAFAIRTSGSGRVAASGAAKRVEIHVSGSSSIAAFDLRAEDVSVDISGSADVDVYATGVLDVHVSGSARVRYAGTPREIHKDISGSGTVEAHAP
ncbi:MAG TPA: head GIN domain-containing protein [Kofleriaceae bacterium]